VLQLWHVGVQQQRRQQAVASQRDAGHNLVSTAWFPA
jgi:hypothetical protein